MGRIPGATPRRMVDLPGRNRAIWGMAVIEPFIEHQGERRGFWLRKTRTVGERLLIVREGYVIPDHLSFRTPIYLGFRSAFGTGGHGTTEGCLIALENTIRGGERVLDVGTGTGILAVAARKLGADHVTAIDIDPRACEEARKNVSRNGVEERVVVVEGGIRSVPGRYDVIAANLRTPVLSEILPDLSDRVERSGVAILSGILERELHPFLSLLADRGFDPPSIRGISGWVTLVAGKRTAP